MKIQKVIDANFHNYGRVLEGYDFEELVKVMEEKPCPGDVIYIPSDTDLEKCQVFEELKKREYGGLPIQIGYCDGHNKKLNALEYHRSSELDIAAGEDLVLLLGKQADITEGDFYDTSKVEAFLVPAGVGVELYATTLHYAPCHVNENGFKCIVVLPKDTNTDLEEAYKSGEERLLAAKNKWLIAHKDAAIEGAFCGLIGENITLD